MMNHYHRYNQPRTSFGFMQSGSLWLVSAVLLFGRGQCSPHFHFDNNRGNGQLNPYGDLPWQLHHGHQLEHLQEHTTQEDRLPYLSSSSRNDMSGYEALGPYIEAGSPFHRHRHLVINVSAQDGSHAYLPCTVKRLGSKSVSWIRKSDGYLLTVDRDVFIGDNRFQALHMIASDTWTLHIRNVVPDDAGIYECQVSSEPKSSLFLHLHIITPQVEIKGSPEIYVNSGSHQVELQCWLTDVLEEPPFIFWYFEDQRLLVESAPDILQLEPQAQAWMLNDYDSIAAHSEEDGNSIGKATDGGGSGFYDDINDHISSDARRNRNNNGEDSVGSSSSSAHGDDDTRMKKTARAHPGHRSRTSTTKYTEIIRLQPGTIVSRLTIFYPSTDDSGRYQCRPSNMAWANVTLHVLDGEHEEPAAAVQSDGSNSSSSVHWRFCIFAVPISMAISILLV